MNFNVKSFVLASMAVAVLSSTTALASNQLRGASKSVNRQLQGTGPVLTPSSDTSTDTDTTDMTFGSTSSGTGSTLTAPPKDKCPVQITLNSSQGGTNVGNGPCFDVGAGCAYELDYSKYAQCNCVQQNPPPPPPRHSSDGPNRGLSDDGPDNGPHHSSDDGPPHDGPHHSSDDGPDGPPPAPPSEWQCFPDPEDGRVTD